jgi:hypothetical protein
MRDSVRDYACLAAAGAGQNQQGAFGMLHSLTLAGIEAIEKVHHLIVACGIRPLVNQSASERCAGSPGNPQPNRIAVKPPRRDLAETEL